MKKHEIGLSEIRQLAESLIEEYMPGQGWTLKLDTAKRRAGICRYGTREIGLSVVYAETITREWVIEVMKHEIAHALVGPGHGHKRVWRDKAIEIGSTGEQYYKGPDADHAEHAKYIGNCGCKEHYRYRLPEAVTSSIFSLKCKKCDGVITWIERAHCNVSKALPAAKPPHPTLF